MPGTFEIKKATNGEFHFNLKAGNGEIILSSETYKTKASAENGIASVKQNAVNDARYDRRSSSGGQPYFVLKAANNEVIGRSETYNSPAAMENGIRSVKDNGPTATTKDLT
jgi:uncharacterized protein